MKKIISISLLSCFALSTVVGAVDTTTSASSTTTSNVSNKTTSIATTTTTTNNIVRDGDRYIIVYGDTLEKIANKYNTTYQELAKYNNIANPNLIYAGNTLYIPTNDKSNITVSEKDYSGVYTGYSWRGEHSGTAFEETTQRIKTTLTLDTDGTIKDLVMDFEKKSGDEWIHRDNPSATLSTNFDITPTVATLGDDKVNGTSMFDIETNDMMSLYVVSVDEDGTVAYGFVDPMTRYLYEAKFTADFDFNTKMGDAVVGEIFIPTTLTSSSGHIKPKAWDEINGKSLFDLDKYSYVSTKRGVYENISNESSVKDLLEKSGVTFSDGKPQPLNTKHGFHSAGGWTGNYETITNYLIGKNATEVTALENFDGFSYDGNSYRDSINEDNFFGYNTDAVSTATRSIQQSWDSTTGATVRISRENTSYQRALVEAGILEEKDVIKGRF